MAKARERQQLLRQLQRLRPRKVGKAKALLRLRQPHTKIRPGCVRLYTSICSESADDAQEYTEVKAWVESKLGESLPLDLHEVPCDRSMSCC